MPAAPAPTPPTLLCLPFAGGSVAVYYPWIKALAPDWKVVPLELPGRGARYREPLVHELDAAIDSLLPHVRAHADGQWALFGHSLGAMLAYELAQTLAASAQPPSLLVTSGRNAPSEPLEIEPVYHLPDRELLEAVRSFGGTAPADAEEEALLSLFVPILRADLRISETYVRPERHGPLPCPVLSFVGREDRLASAVRTSSWARETAAGFRLVEHDGGHFAVFESHFAPTLRQLLVSALNDRDSSPSR